VICYEQNVISFLWYVFSSFHAGEIDRELEEQEADENSHDHQDITYPDTKTVKDFFNEHTHTPSTRTVYKRPIFCFV